MTIMIYLANLLEVDILLMVGIHHQVVDIEFILHIELHKIQQFMHNGQQFHQLLIITFILIALVVLIVQQKN